MNGWQRIWVVSGVVLLLFIGIVLEDIPTKKDIYRSWADQTINHTLQIDEFKNLSLGSIRNSYSDFTDKQILEKVQSKFSDEALGYNLDFSEINTLHEKKLEKLLFSQIKFIGFYLGIWILIMLAIYSFGWSIGWIIRGFKKTKKLM